MHREVTTAHPAPATALHSALIDYIEASTAYMEDFILQIKNALS